MSACSWLRQRQQSFAQGRHVPADGAPEVEQGRWSQACLANCACLAAQRPTSWYDQLVHLLHRRGQVTLPAPVEEALIPGPSLVVGARRAACRGGACDMNCGPRMGGLRTEMDELVTSRRDRPEGNDACAPAACCKPACGGTPQGPCRAHSAWARTAASAKHMLVHAAMAEHGSCAPKLPCSSRCPCVRTVAGTQRMLVGCIGCRGCASAASCAHETLGHLRNRRCGQHTANAGRLHRLPRLRERCELCSRDPGAPVRLLSRAHAMGSSCAWAPAAADLLACGLARAPCCAASWGPRPAASPSSRVS